MYVSADQGMSSNLRQNILSTSLAHKMSDVLNSYRMFHPSGPYLRRSWTVAWKKASPTRSFFQYSSSRPSRPVWQSHSTAPRLVNVPIRFARIPRGGSLVSLMPPWSTATGKNVDGWEVSHSRKFSSSTPWVVKFSTIFSRAGIHDVQRWQFIRHTHSPFLVLCAMSFSATGPWPCPREMDWNFWRKPISSANLISDPVGSDPAVRTKMIGEVVFESGNTSASTIGGDSVNSLPIFSATYISVAKTSFSSRKSFRAHILWKELSELLYGAGIAIRCGESALDHTFHSLRWSRMWSVKPPNCSGRASWIAAHASQIGCAITAGSGFFGGASERPPLRRKFHSRALISLELRRMEEVMRNEKTSLWRSNSPRQTLRYRNFVTYAIRICRRASRSSLLSEASMQLLNINLKYSREYWYIGSMFERSAITK
mmetsp:Transcript_62721/g.143733  ORF Transcript_62721/g.143733 Transcript_62721/m.143733 type:complete len:427 (-) Transcript_62721:2721-4001(-)